MVNLHENPWSSGKLDNSVTVTETCINISKHSAICAKWSKAPLESTHHDQILEMHGDAFSCRLYMLVHVCPPCATPCHRTKAPTDQEHSWHAIMLEIPWHFRRREKHTGNANARHHKSSHSCTMKNHWTMSSASITAWSRPEMSFVRLHLRM